MMVSKMEGARRMRKLSVWAILLCVLLLLTACGKATEAVNNSATAETSSTVVADSSTPDATPEVSSTPSAPDSTGFFRKNAY